MENYQFWTLVAMIAGGFGWVISWLKEVDNSVNELDKRVTIMETRITLIEMRITVMETRIGFIERLLEMIGNIRIANNQNKERTDP